MYTVARNIITRRGVPMSVGQLPALGSEAPSLSNLIKKDWTNTASQGE
jgi:hypothetical protein